MRFGHCEIKSSKIQIISTLFQVENAPPPIVIGDGDNDAGVRTCGNMSTGAKIKCLSVIFIPILALVIAIMVDSFHVIEEGNVGIYYRQGALQVKHKNMVINQYLVLKG